MTYGLMINQRKYLQPYCCWKIRTIYSSQLSLGIFGSPHRFQVRLSDLIQHRECAKLFLDDFLVLTKVNHNDQLLYLKELLNSILDKGLKV